MKRFSLFAMAVLCISSLGMIKGEVNIPAVRIPTENSDSVLVIFSPTYFEALSGRLAFQPANWTTWNITDTCIYTEDMRNEGFLQDWNDSVDVSAYKQFHADIWDTVDATITITFEALHQNFKGGKVFNLTANQWNHLVINLEEDFPAYNFQDLKIIMLEKFIKRPIEVDDTVSAEGTPLAITNIYFSGASTPAYVPPTRDYFPATAPALPKYKATDVIGVLCEKYNDPTKDINFSLQTWGTQTWEDSLYANGTRVYYTPALGWDALTNSDDSTYDVGAYQIFHVDIWSEVDDTFYLSFEAFGSGWKHGDSVSVVEANTWTSFDIDIEALGNRFDNYLFGDLRYILLNAAVERHGVAIANMYFRKKNAREETGLFDTNNTANSSKVVKYVKDGQLIIERNGRKYNVHGTEL